MSGWIEVLASNPHIVGFGIICSILFFSYGIEKIFQWGARSGVKEWEEGEDEDNSGVDQEG